MYGILSEESFESNHQKMKAEAALCAKIADSKIRANVMNRRLQVSIQQDVQSVARDFIGKVTG